MERKSTILFNTYRRSLLMHCCRSTPTHSYTITYIWTHTHSHTRSHTHVHIAILHDIHGHIPHMYMLKYIFLYTYLYTCTHTLYETLLGVTTKSEEDWKSIPGEAKVQKFLPFNLNFSSLAESPFVLEDTFQWALLLCKYKERTLHSQWRPECNKTIRVCILQIETLNSVYQFKLNISFGWLIS